MNQINALRHAEDRGYADHGWLKSYHSFSFAGYFDPQHMAFGPLRVINEDRIAAGAGFPTHAHQDMEIISYVLDGTLAHQDNLGNGSSIRPGDVQLMSAGTGVQHSEYNHEANGETHFLQIWIMPNQRSVKPSYQQKYFAPEDKNGKWALIAAPVQTQSESPDGASDQADNAVKVQQDVYIYAAILRTGHELNAQISNQRLGYIHVASGEVLIDGQRLKAGDALKIQGAKTVALSNASNAEVLLFDLPPAA